MAGIDTELTIKQNADQRRMFFEQLDAAGVTDPPMRLQGRVIVQIAGTATDIEATVEHATQDPGSGQEDWAPAESEIFSGDLSAGIPPRELKEPAIGWWRVNVTSLTGGYARVSIIGESA